MTFHSEGIGGVIFLFLYLINLGILVYGFTTRRIVLKSVYTLLLFHVLLRVAAQSIAIVIATKANLDIGLLIAFFVLAAEGYFSLVLCAYRFLINHHQHSYPTDGSWLEGKPRKKDDGKRDPLWKRCKRAMTARDENGNKDPWVMTIIHWVLLGANITIINGGTRVNGSDIGEPDYWSEMYTAKILRSVGQAIFLLINLFLAIFLYLTINQDKSVSGTLPRCWTRFFRVKPDHGSIDSIGRIQSRTLDPTVKILIIAWPPLVVRGIFGLLQALVDPINYSHPESYRYADGNLSFTRLFVVMENIFSVLPEWSACCLLVSTMFTRRDNHPYQVELRQGQASAETTREHVPERKVSAA